jgi:hypothetical protein
MKKTKILLFLLFISLYGYSQFQVVMKNEFETWSYSPKVITVEGNIITTVIKKDPTPLGRKKNIKEMKELDPHNAKRYDRYNYSLIALMFNCTDQTYHLVNFAVFDNKKKQIYRENFPPSQWKPITQNTMIGGFTSTLCKLR